MKRQFYVGGDILSRCIFVPGVFPVRPGFGEIFFSRGVAGDGIMVLRGFVDLDTINAGVCVWIRVMWIEVECRWMNHI